jgi:hypothetical protein
MKYYATQTPSGLKLHLLNDEAPFNASESTTIRVHPPFIEEDEGMDFFDAWEVSGDKLVVNLDKAKDIRIRDMVSQRDRALKQLDHPHMSALLSGDTKEVAEIESKKDELRKIPSSVDWSSVDSLYAIKHINPPALGVVM